jgi:predicted DNA-binding transcriptional regulator AlpA
VTARKQTMPRTPAYVSRATLAAELEVSESTVDDMVKRGVLPAPVNLSPGCVRWQWEAVRTALASLVPGSDTSNPEDPFLAGVRHATKIQEGGRRRGAS